MIRLYAKRLLSGMLTLCLCIGFLPMTATAADIAAPADGNFTLLWVPVSAAGLLAALGLRRLLGETPAPIRWI